MLKWIALLLFCAPALTLAQAPVAIAPGQCVWRAGDNPAWAAPALDESGWHSYAGWSLDPHEPQIWIRCHADLAPLRSIADPGIQVAFSSAYELYVNGSRIGASGNLHRGLGRNDLIRSWPLPQDLAGNAAVIALRITFGPALYSDYSASVSFGSLALLKDSRDSQVLAAATQNFGMAVCYIVIGAIGLALLGLFLSDRSRTELFWLGVSCFLLATLRLCIFALRVQAPISSIWLSTLFNVGNVILPIAETLFFFRVAVRRIPPLVIGLVCIETAWAFSGVVAFAAPTPRMIPFDAFLFQPWTYSAMLLSALLQVAASAWFAFMPLRSLPRRIRVVALLCCTWALADCIWFAIESTTAIPGLPDLFDRWYSILAESRGYALLAIVVALMALLLREQRQIAEERAMLAGEMQAAREIQSLLAPDALCPMPGFEIEVAYRPIRDVGGDFYLCRPLANGRQRLLVGDVSGKGTGAAMTAALLIGGAEDHDDYAPAQLLAHLDRVLRESRVGALATCLCADFAADGSVTFANAGHLPPFRHGVEISLPANLPLGVRESVAAHFDETVVHLHAGESLTFLSDGVVEARNARGELFGFARAAAISAQPAESVARAAQSFGQEDDITVLRLTRAERAPASVVLSAGASV